jgi:hypothetical protein
VNTSASAPATIGLPSSSPNTPPLSAATTPSAVNKTVMPATNAVESSAPSARLRTLRAPNTLTVIAIIG